MAENPVSKESAEQADPVIAPDAAPAESGSTDAKLAAETSTQAIAAAAPEAPAPKRRGRPPKAAAPDTPTPKRRGRPPKAASAKATAAKSKAATDTSAKSAAPNLTAAPKPAKTSAKATVAKPKPAKPAKPVSAPAVAAKKSTTVPKAANKTAFAPSKIADPSASTSQIRKEPSIMDMSANFTTFQDSMAEAQAKAKEAFEKTTGMFGEVSEFAKGNVEAMIESGKIFSEGVQEMGTTMAAEGKAAFETMSADMKELAAVKSPTDFMKLQGEMMRKNFDSAVAYGSKNSEAMLKLMSDTMAPLSGRVSMAVDKVRQAAI
jgi:hypothetical protein